MTTRCGLAVLGSIAGVVLGGCGGGASTSPSTAASGRGSSSGHRVVKPRLHQPPAYPRLLAAATGPPPRGFVPAVSWRGRTVAWVARRGGVTLLAFDQRLASLRLHSGTVDAGAAGWRYGPEIAGRERRRLVAAFNGGFKLDTNSGGFVLGGRVAVPLSDGLGSIVTYASGYTDVGAWHQDVPAPAQSVVSVRQNLHLLITGGRRASNLDCLLCWGSTLGGTATPARSALGVASGRLIWAAGENLSPAALASAMLDAGVQRAVELDINPEWVAAYLYDHHHSSGRPVPIPVVPGQNGIPGEFLAPYSRDFFTIAVR